MLICTSFLQPYCHACEVPLHTHEAVQADETCWHRGATGIFVRGNVHEHQFTTKALSSELQGKGASQQLGLRALIPVLGRQTHQEVHRHLMQCFPKRCLGSVAGFTEVHASLKTSAKGNHVTAPHPCKLLGPEEVHGNFAWCSSWDCMGQHIVSSALYEGPQLSLIQAS